MTAASRRRGAGATACGTLSAAFALVCGPAGAHLAPQQRSVLTHYLSALQGGRYSEAFLLLSDDERRYFGSAANFASAYTTDRLALRSYRILGTLQRGKATVALVVQHVRFFDFARRRRVGLVAEVQYALSGRPDSPRIVDPYHPWKACAPQNLVATAGRFRVTVDSISFFPGRIDVVATFANVGEGAVTLLPYGRSIARDDAGRAYFPLQSRSAALTDRTLYGGLRLPGNAQYTGHMAFSTPARFRPTALSFTFGPALRDGADAPFEIALRPTTTRTDGNP